MSIEKYWIEGSNYEYIPTCDNCGDELPAEFTFDGAVEAKRAANWKSAKADGEWFDFCPACYLKKNGAASDFSGVTT